MMSIGVGATAGVSWFISMEAIHDFSPANLRQEQVLACASLLSDKATNVIKAPEACRLFDDPFFNYETYSYDLPSSFEFSQANMPDGDYNLEQVNEYARESIFVSVAGVLITAAAYVTINADEKLRGSSNGSHVSRFAGNILIKRKKHKSIHPDQPGHFNGLPLDSTDNDKEITNRYERLKDDTET